MCMGLSDPLVEGDTLAVSLDFESGAAVRVAAAIEQR